MADLAEIFRALPAGQRRALLALTRDWQFPSVKTFDGNAAYRLGRNKAGALAEQGEVKGRSRYRVTKLGELVRSFDTGSRRGSLDTGSRLRSIPTQDEREVGHG
jgi:hypothetical protein